MSHTKRTHRGLALIELIGSLFIMTTIMGLSAVCFHQVIRLRTELYRHEQRADGADHVLRRIAGEVRGASGFLASTGKYRSGKSVLILKTPTGPVVFFAVPGRVDRVTPGSGKGAVAVLDAPDVNLEFEMDRAAATSSRSVVVTAFWPGTPNLAVKEPTLSLRAAPRNGEGRR